MLSSGVLPVSARNINREVPTSEIVHGPDSRQYWRDGYDIWTDYTDNSLVPPPGKLVEVCTFHHSKTKQSANAEGLV